MPYVQNDQGEWTWEDPPPSAPDYGDAYVPGGDPYGGWENPGGNWTGDPNWNVPPSGGPEPDPYWPNPTVGDVPPAIIPTSPGPTPTPSPAPPPPRPPSSGGGGGGGYGTPSFNWPTFKGPDLPTISPINAPPPFTVSPFAYDPFAPPSLEQAQNEPGYAFARGEGQRALENSAAARGTLRTGGTLKDLIGWGNRFAEQNYGNVYNRAANTYGINRGNAFDTWGANNEASAKAYDTNFGVTKDVYDRTSGTALDLWDRAFNSAVATFNPQFDASRLTFQDIYNRDRDRLNAQTQIATAGAGL